MNEYTTNQPIGSTVGNIPIFSTGANPPAHQGSKWQTEPQKNNCGEKYCSRIHPTNKETTPDFSGSIYKHIVYNPHMRNIDAVIDQAQEDGKDWQFSHAQPVNEYEYVAVFEKWIY